MEALPETPLLKHPPDTLYQIRKLFDLEKPGRMKEAIDILEEWIQKQEHFESKNFDRNYLELLIIMCKGSLEKAKQKIDSLCTMRTLAPEFFDTELMEVKLNRTRCLYVVMPMLTPDYYAIIVGKEIPGDLTFEDHMNLTKDWILCTEYMLRVAYFVGVICVVDLRNANLKEILLATSLTVLRKYIQVVREGYGIRLKAIHFLSNIKLIETYAALVKQILPDKIASRTYVHSSVESLHKVLPRELLSKDLGGDQPPLDDLNKLRIEIANSKEHIEHMKEIVKQRTDESKRIGGKIEMDELPGTFRCLDVD